MLDSTTLQHWEGRQLVFKPDKQRSLTVFGLPNLVGLAV